MIQLEILQVLDCPNVPLLEQTNRASSRGCIDRMGTAPPGHRGFPISSTRGLWPGSSDVARRRPRSLSRVKSDPERVLQGSIAMPRALSDGAPTVSALRRAFGMD